MNRHATYTLAGNFFDLPSGRPVVGTGRVVPLTGIVVPLTGIVAEEEEADRTYSVATSGSLPVSGYLIRPGRFLQTIRG